MNGRYLRLLAACGVVASYALWATVPLYGQEGLTALQAFTHAWETAKGCTYKTYKANLDDHDNLKGGWKEEKEGGSSILQKFVDGDEDYWRALRALDGSVEPNAAGRKVEASLKDELWYKGGIFKLRSLSVTLHESLSEDGWYPQRLFVKIRYWAGLFVWPLGGVTHEAYKLDITCPTARP